MKFTQHELQILHEIYEIIDRHENQHIHITDIVANYHISESTITKAYKYLFKKTITQHRLENKMKQAKTMIQNGIQIKTVAIELGYKTTRSFSKTFKKTIGFAPSKYTLHSNVD